MRHLTKVKGYKLPPPRPSPSDFPLPSPLAGLSQVVRSRLSNVASSITKVSGVVKSRLFSLVRGCVKIIMGEQGLDVQYATLDIRHESYNMLQQRVISAIICISRRGGLKIDDDLFDAFSYSLFWGLRKHDAYYFYHNCTMAVKLSTPGSHSWQLRKDALDNMQERFNCVRVLVKEGAYNADHVEKVYQYHPENDKDIPFKVKIYRYNLVSVINDKGEMSIRPEISSISVPILEIFGGTGPNAQGYYNTTLSDFSSLLSSIIDQVYFKGVREKKRVAILDLSCGCFSRHQGSVPNVPELDLGMGGGKKINKRYRKATATSKIRRNERNERRERNKSKIRNRIRNRIRNQSSRSRQTRKKRHTRRK
jgi:hypothetical protein